MKSEVEKVDSLEKIVREGLIPNGESASSLWKRTEVAWEKILEEFKRVDEEDDSRNIVLVADEIICASILAHCLQLSADSLDLFHLDSSSLNVVDFPDGPGGNAVVRCLNYTAHLGRWAVPVTLPVANDEDF